MVRVWLVTIDDGIRGVYSSQRMAANALLDLLQADIRYYAAVEWREVHVLPKGSQQGETPVAVWVLMEDGHIRGVYDTEEAASGRLQWDLRAGRYRCVNTGKHVVQGSISGEA